MLTRGFSRASLGLAAAICVFGSVWTSAQGQQRNDAEPTSPAARSFHDAKYGVRVQVPAGWNFTQKDGELSTFHLDARSAGRKAQLRAVATLAFNPYPASTFSGALFYFSVQPQTSEAECATEASGKTTPKEARVNGVIFAYGHDEHGTICVEARDEVYTTRRADSCYRFDLVMNSFCGGEVSGAEDMTQAQMDDIRKRLESILNTVVIDAK